MVINNIVKAQCKQLKYANRQYPHTTRSKYAVTTYITHNAYKPQHYKHAQIGTLTNKVAIKPFKRYNNATLRYIHNHYLKHYKIGITATLLNGVFFNNYHQAYNSLMRMVGLKLLTKHNGIFWLKTAN